MTEESFIGKHSNTWKLLENALSLLKRKGVKGLSNEQIHEFLSLYNKVSGHLSISQTSFGSSSHTTSYLNELTASAHSYIYSTRSSGFGNLIKFFTVGFPRLIKEQWIFISLAAAFLTAGFLFSYIYTMISPDYAASFLPQYLIDSMNLSPDGARELPNSSIMSTYIFTNNIKVGIMAFALGITFGLGTIYVLFSNGLLIGALAALAQQQQQGYIFWSLILPHGITELFCIFICGASGLLIGYGIIRPNLDSRRNSFINHGKLAVKLVLGSIPLFVIAGLIEGFFTPLSISVNNKYLFSILTLLLLFLYLTLPNFINRKKKAAIHL